MKNKSISDRSIRRGRRKRGALFQRWEEGGVRGGQRDYPPSVIQASKESPHWADRSNLGGRGDDRFELIQGQPASSGAPGGQKVMIVFERYLRLPYFDLITRWLNRSPVQSRPGEDDAEDEIPPAVLAWSSSETTTNPPPTHDGVGEVTSCSVPPTFIAEEGHDAHMAKVNPSATERETEDQGCRFSSV